MHGPFPSFFAKADSAITICKLLRKAAVLLDSSGDSAGVRSPTGLKCWKQKAPGFPQPCRTGASLPILVSDDTRVAVSTLSSPSAMPASAAVASIQSHPSVFFQLLPHKPVHFYYSLIPASKECPGQVFTLHSSSCSTTPLFQVNAAV